LDALSEFRPSLGILENREEALISIDQFPLEQRIGRYLDSEVDWETLRASDEGLTKNFARFDARKTREKLLAAGITSTVVRRLLVRPMDLRWCYYTDVRPLWNEPRPDYVEQMWQGNRALVSRRKGVASPEGVPFFITSSIGYQHTLHTDAYFCPLRLRSLPKRPKDHKQRHLLQEAPQSPERANLSQSTRNYLREIEMTNPDSDEATAGLVWMHALAIGYSPAFLSENADGIRQDWPHIPLPRAKDLFLASSKIGVQVAALLDTELPASRVTTGDLRAELKSLGLPSRTEGGALREDELGITAGWGHAGKGGVTMPGQGQAVPRDYTKTESETIATGVKALGLSPEQALALLGSKTFDLYLNPSAYWANVPEKVWDYTIGGYQVIKKWLSYREQKLLGRPLIKDEVRYVQEMVRRIAAILLMQPALDSNYRAVKADAYPWPPKQ
jgi:hypothetical protein